MIANIALGLLGLGIVVFVHELGHFVAARLVGIDVDAFSVGLGRAILKKKIRGVEYRLGMFPLGGYCGMRGADGTTDEAGEQDTPEPAKGSYFAAGPLRRIAVCLAGPVFNLVFAAMVFSIILGVGHSLDTGTGMSPQAAVAGGVRMTWKVLVLSVDGISGIFRDRNVTDLAGPARLIYMVGDAATASFEYDAAAGATLGESIAAGAETMAFLLAFVSIAIAIMNLLPIPVFDGGRIVLYLVELVRRKPTPPRALMVFQTVGVVMVAALMIFVFFGDTMFFVGRFGGR